MTPLALANRYMDIFYSTGAIRELAEILAPDCVFEGPFYRFDNAKAYIDSLIDSPPRGMRARVIERYENERSACLIYQFSKDDISCEMCQRFEVCDGLITRITLIFDSACFPPSS